MSLFLWTVDPENIWDFFAFLLFFYSFRLCVLLFGLDFRLHFECERL